MAERYKFEFGNDPEKEKNRITQNLAVIAHDLHFQAATGKIMSADLYSYEIANAIAYIKWLYGKVYGENAVK